ncbi:TOM1-like protein 2 isoform X2 [Limulus polyphemus]|uniref:TOM1-like protein 2 isoform X2 n=1 Tax=Limulus polyphemus TaxID=6850 RepID=A0ABM1SIN6_LIMPO|nr:TOM1-like protein 2 isoform X2 [Limulus polyphemus]
METILSQFGGNPFVTPVGQKIEQATDASLTSENWALNLEICDVINDTDEGPKDAIKALRKRLQQNAGKNYAVVMFTLTVLETCVKNCGKKFHVLVMQRDFVMDLVKLIGPKNNPPIVVQEKVLSLIQSWADAFRSNLEMQGVVQVYEDLKQKGVEFPMTDLDTMAPIHTPKRTMPLDQEQPKYQQCSSKPEGHHHKQPASHQATPAQSSRPINLTSEQLEKLRKELDVVQVNMNVFGEMLTGITSGKEEANDWELVQDVCQTCRAMQSRIVDLIGQVANEEVTSELLRVNDELNNLFLRYERYQKKKSGVCQNKLVQSLPKQENEMEEKPLIDFRDNITSSDDIHVQLAGMSTSSDNATSAVSQITTVSAYNKLQPSNLTESGEFDMFAQSRNVSYEQSKISGSTYEDNMNLNQVDGSLGLLAHARGRPQEKKEDFDELERWLENKAAKDKADQPSITSSEFDNFLAERSAEAGHLPITTTASNASGKRPFSRDEEENSLFAL